MGNQHGLEVERRKSRFYERPVLQGFQIAAAIDAGGQLAQAEAFLLEAGDGPQQLAAAHDQVQIFELAQGDVAMGQPGQRRPFDGHERDPARRQPFLQAAQRGLRPEIVGGDGGLAGAQPARPGGRHDLRHGLQGALDQRQHVVVGGQFHEPRPIHGRARAEKVRRFRGKVRARAGAEQVHFGAGRSERRKARFHRPGRDSTRS